MTWPQFEISSAYREKHPGLPFGLALIRECEPSQNPPGFDQHKRKLLRKLRKRETLSEISARIGIYDMFFKSFGFECPLPKHLRRTIHSGFPRYNLMVDTHFMAEMCAGILVAVADYDCFEGGLTLDLAREGEICMGMGNRKLTAKEGEIVLRDERGIVCILCQGADEKTRVRETTRNVLFYSYAVPGIEGRHLQMGLSVAADTLAQFGGGIVEGIRVY
ncbi:MAG: hypothetical protein JRJ03_16200 [Deltaproteobacteria bacterium]|nr:hypothetical protein [Deltaproteobacteria bacterium]